jgi:4-carboxymuconolactone decarboxylase
MTRITAPKLSEMTPEQRRVAEKVAARIGGIQGPYVPWLTEPALCERILDLLDYLRDGTPLPARHRLLAGLLTVRHWRADYAWSATAPRAHAAGLRDAVVAAIERGDRPDFDDESDRVVYDLVSELLGSRALGDETYRRALACLGEAALRDAVVTVGYFCVVSLTLLAYDVAPGGLPDPKVGTLAPQDV